MSSTWFINLKEKIDRTNFDKIMKTLNIQYKPEVIFGNTYYDGGVEINFGGIGETEPEAPYATQITIRTVSQENGYQLMKRTALNIADHIPFKDISGEWFDCIAEKDEEEEPIPLPYTSDVFKLIEGN